MFYKTQKIIALVISAIFWPVISIASAQESGDDHARYIAFVCSIALSITAMVWLVGLTLHVSWLLWPGVTFVYIATGAIAHRIVSGIWGLTRW